MKKLFCAFIAACMLFTLCACSSDGSDVSAPAGTIYVENEILKVSTCYPIDWKVDRNDGMLSLLRDTSESSMISTYASVSVTKYNTNAADYSEYWEDYSERLSEELKDYKAIEEEEIKVGGNTAGSYHYTATVDGSTYHFVQVVAVGGYSAYIITFTASDTDYENIKPEFDEIILNFSFK